MRNEIECSFEAPEVSQSPASTLEFNAERYAGHLADIQMTEEQKAELMEALWSIMWSFVQMGVDPKNCGQLAVGAVLASSQPQTIIESFADSAGKNGSI